MYLLVGIGGITGSLLRYSLSLLTVQLWGEGFPIGTIMINLSGSFLIGWFTSKYVASKKLSPSIISFFSTGCIGSFTTFSTFSLESILLIAAGLYLKAFVYVIVSLFGGLFFVKLGLNLGAQREKEVGKIV